MSGRIAWVIALAFGQRAKQLTVTAANTLPFARSSQTIELTARQLAFLGEQDLAKIHVADVAGKDLIVQAVDTDFDDYHKPDIIIRERFDDFAWENDRIAHRTYGKALETWKGEPLTSSAIDIWSKLGPKLVIDEWYMMGDPLYHEMTDNGGDGGNGVWANDRLWTPTNFVSSRELANGPVRVMFELEYPEYTAGGVPLLEVMRVSLDAGSQLDHYHVTFTPRASADSIVGAIGLKKVAGAHKTFGARRGTLATWEPMEKDRGMQGLAVVADPRRIVRDAEDSSNHLLLVGTGASRSMDYRAGFAWDRAGRITSEAAWLRHVSDFADGLRSPIQVTVSEQ